MKYFKTNNFILLLIVIFGFFLRIINVENVPSGLFVDEASIGYNAFTILKFGTDENGVKFPLLFQNFGDFYRPGISIYLTTIPVFFFGLSELSIRLTAIIIGTTTICMVYLIGKLLFNKNVGILSALFLAISPWHIHFSRINQEFIYLCFFLSLGLWIFLEGVSRHKQYLVAGSGIIFGLSIYTYVTAYALVPLFFLILLIVYHKQLSRLKYGFIFFILIFLMMLIPLIIGLENGKTLSRFTQVSANTDKKTVQEIWEKASYTYARHFSYQFLFEKGDIDEPGHFITRFSVKGMGQLYTLQIPFIILGIVFAFKKNKKSFLVIMGWLAIYPLGSTLVPFSDGGGPFAMRSITGVVPFQILTAAGIYYIYKLLKKFKKTNRIFLALLILSVVLSCSLYLFKYHKEYPLYSSDFWGWQFGPKPIMQTFLSEKNIYDELIMYGDFNSPDTLLKFYDPNNTCDGKCFIGDLDNLSDEKRQLFAIQADKLMLPLNASFSIKKTIVYPNRQPAFFIGEISQNKL